jgi:hypothetical protein
MGQESDTEQKKCARRKQTQYKHDGSGKMTEQGRHVTESTKGMLVPLVPRLFTDKGGNVGATKLAGRMGR